MKQFKQSQQLHQVAKKRKEPGCKGHFESPEQLLEEAQKYFDWVDDNPIITVKPILSGPNVGELVEVPKQVPYTLVGLLLFLGVSHSYFRTFKSLNKESDDEKVLAKLAIIEQIEDFIETQQFNGATAGIFQQNIIAMKLGLQNKSKVVTDDGEGGDAPLSNNFTFEVSYVDPDDER